MKKLGLYPKLFRLDILYWRAEFVCIPLSLLLATPVFGACTPAATEVGGDISLRLPFRAGEQYPVTQGYCGSNHTGYEVDFGLPTDTVVVAAAPGTVSEVGDYAGNCPTGCSDTVKNAGTYVKIRHLGATTTWYSSYLHLNCRLLNKDDIVQAGQPIGYSGNTGWSEGAHLHFHIRNGPTASDTGVRPTPMQGIDIAAGLSTITTFSVDQTYRAAGAAVFNAGDAVEVFGRQVQGLPPLPVRSPDACSPAVTSQPDGTRGTIIGGPLFCNDYNRWLVQWADNTRGWSGQNWLKKVGSSNVSGAWTVSFAGPATGTCSWEIHQSGTNLTITGPCDFAGTVNLVGTINPDTGAFSASGPTAAVCGTATINGIASRETDSMSGTFNCAAYTGTFTGVRVTSYDRFRWSGNGHFYEPVVTPERISWTAASNAAVAAGGYLVTITSAAENDFVFSLIDSDVFWKLGGNSHGPWIGAFQPHGSTEPAGGWTWVTGEPFSFKAWALGEPNGGVGENYANFYGPGGTRAATWNDFAQDVCCVGSYVIEFDTAVILANVAVTPSGTTPGAKVFGFSFPTTVGESYLIEFKNFLTKPVWRWLRTIIGDGRLKTFSDEIKLPSRFYRVLKETEQVSVYLKLPLPGGRSWLLTTEIGGGDCANPGQQLESHTGRNYYSIDLDDSSLEGGQEAQVPVLAAGDGRVIFTSTEEDPFNGFYVVIDHDTPYDGSGYTTRYLHLEGPPLVHDGQEVVQGQKLGLVGNTGLSTGSHLHFGVRYNNDGSITVPELGQVRLEGLKLSQFKCDAGTPTGYYYSTNVPRE